VPGKPYHPPALSAYSPPVGDFAGYIMGATGPQGFGCREFYVGRVSAAFAKDIIRRFHYSRRVVNNSYLHLGVYIGGEFRGVLSFGYALCPARACKVVAGTVQGQYLELNRMWLSDEAPHSSESRAISYAVKYIRVACPTVAWIQSYADERCGGYGVVYQAANFLYIGCHKTTFYELDGETYHDMLLTAHKKSGNRGEYLRANLDRAEKRTLRQFWYIFFLKRDWMRRLNFKVQPPPKREEM
jgi:hypothetical protein